MQKAKISLRKIITQKMNFKVHTFGFTTIGIYLRIIKTYSFMGKFNFFKFCLLSIFLFKWFFKLTSKLDLLFHFRTLELKQSEAEKNLFKTNGSLSLSALAKNLRKKLMSAHQDIFFINKISLKTLLNIKARKPLIRNLSLSDQSRS